MARTPAPSPSTHLEQTRARVELVTYPPGGSGGCYEVAPLMAPKICHFVGMDTPTPWGMVQGTPSTPYYQPP